EASTSDGNMLVMAHDLPGPGAAVTALGASARSRLIAAGYADGHVRVFQVTSERRVVETTTNEPVQAGRFAPKDDGLLALSATSLTRWQFNMGHPEVSFAALFRPVWYEGGAKPEHKWQTSGGSDAVEPKLGMWPLVYGTLKATVYSLLMAVPL